MKLLEQIQALDFPADLPKTLLRVKQSFDAPQVPDVGAAAKHALHEGGILAKMKSGATVAVGVGSRGGGSRSGRAVSGSGCAALELSRSGRRVLGRGGERRRQARRAPGRAEQQKRGHHEQGGAADRLLRAAARTKRSDEGRTESTHAGTFGTFDKRPDPASAELGSAVSRP